MQKLHTPYSMTIQHFLVRVKVKIFFNDVSCTRITGLHTKGCTLMSCSSLKLQEPVHEFSTLPRGRRGMSDISVLSDMCLTKSSDTCPTVSYDFVRQVSYSVLRCPTVSYGVYTKSLDTIRHQRTPSDMCLTKM